MPITSERVRRLVQVSHFASIPLDRIEWIDCAIDNKPRQRFTLENDRIEIIALRSRYGCAMVIWCDGLHKLTQPVRELQTLTVKVKE